MSVEHPNANAHTHTYKHTHTNIAHIGIARTDNGGTYLTLHHIIIRIVKPSLPSSILAV
jgi:hypothetical protein